MLTSHLPRAGRQAARVPAGICQARQLITKSPRRPQPPIGPRPGQLTGHDGLRKSCRSECLCLILIGGSRRVVTGGDGWRRGHAGNSAGDVIGWLKTELFILTLCMLRRPRAAL
ncbi:hypothetical protein E2C01_031362 [Portunus trituberculatus]|uniref:Uncharacterized protein n=1 Tax=Portunus trituberculatus TaxID=210409 RepID=A0A5B7EXX3_PORTR|nr:hypothetical protein [Portunus trituberculatus]